MISTTWNIDEGLALFVGSGQVSLIDIGTALQEAMSKDEYAATNASVWVLSDAELDVSQSDIYELIPSIEALAAAAPEGRKLAWVVEFELHKAIIDLVYKDYQWMSEWRVFQDLDEALAWCAPQ